MFRWVFKSSDMEHKINRNLRKRNLWGLSGRIIRSYLRLTAQLSNRLDSHGDETDPFTYSSETLGLDDAELTHVPNEI